MKDQPTRREISPANLPSLLLYKKNYPKGAVKGFKNIWLLPTFFKN
jgi:hypothetical protein